ncbi:glycosyltransferase family 4 protein [Pedobacter sp. HDW13]|uniref:glycosyltransferase family 4 protein n=1 Tax=Pedobacter sp. HDW13 TaxID=2714940 RepID=UPI0014082E3A|nr:glycosyltransferase family 4 protein [Pedobacter sp. HDW13]QIL39212.1 glycosyltransferase family 4 protein [Pedobacter sp. HDW13]
MKFVHVEDFFHPNAGYQLNLLTKLQVEQGHDVTIVASEMQKMPDFLTSFFGKDNIEEKDKQFTERTGVKVVRHPIYRFYSGRSIFKPGLHKKIRSLKPDVLFMHNEDTLTGIKLLWAYKRMNVPYVLDCHMLEMASENKFSEYFRKFYRKFVTPIILKNNIPLIRVVDSDFVQKHYHIPLEKTKLLSFGTDVNYFKPDSELKQKFRAELKIEKDDYVVLYAGKLDVSKGALQFAEAIKNKIELENRAIKFVIVGNSLDNEYGKKVDSILQASENNILRFPTQNYYELVRFYQLADVAVYPRQCSMSYFEAQACGLPVVLEENEINIERASNKKGIIFSEGSVEEFRQAIFTFGSMPKEEFSIYKNNSVKNIVDNFNFVNVAQKFTDIMLDEYHKFKNRRRN